VSKRSKAAATTSLDRIVFDPRITGGMACILGMRIPFRSLWAKPRFADLRWNAADQLNPARVTPSFGTVAMP
jgi:hypothetical protein